MVTTVCGFFCGIIVFRTPPPSSARAELSRVHRRGGVGTPPPSKDAWWLPPWDVPDGAFPQGGVHTATYQTQNSGKSCSQLSFIQSPPQFVKYCVLV